MPVQRGAGEQDRVAEDAAAVVPAPARVAGRAVPLDGKLTRTRRRTSTAWTEVREG
ncbi:hypothetical protein [Streptomyces palmae]|uniref:hypothetical protein n=1 Tax=Streptomyces palmae TaxID=1701085 RepID=UPI0014330D11|nr:hypothetical protein [Streptomyces palmae]